MNGHMPMIYQEIQIIQAMNAAARPPCIILSPMYMTQMKTTFSPKSPWNHSQIVEIFSNKMYAHFIAK